MSLPIALLQRMKTKGLREILAGTPISVVMNGRSVSVGSTTSDSRFHSLIAYPYFATG